MSKRASCPYCGFILARCLCDTLRSIPNKTHLLILQHKSEPDHALNTVALMKKSFQNLTVLVGEDFSDHKTLNELIETNQKSLALLYPSEKSSVLNEQTYNNELTHLILIDGTWKKAHKIFILSKNLHKLPCLKLEVSTSSQYKIRSSKLEHSLSTLEASIIALAVIEKDLGTQSLTESFKKMIGFQIEKMGIDIFRKNYGRED